eukprot:3211368-Rhodomonas_salina.3
MKSCSSRLSAQPSMNWSRKGRRKTCQFPTSTHELVSRENQTCQFWTSYSGCTADADGEG